MLRTLMSINYANGDEHRVILEKRYHYFEKRNDYFIVCITNGKRVKERKL